MSIAGPGNDKELGSQSYGMGFFLTSYRGHYLVHHGGNIDGFSALVTFMPQDNIGMVILTNQNGSSAPAVVSYNVYDRMLGLDQIDWTKRFKEQQEKGKSSAEDAKKKGYTAQRTGTHPSHELAEYAGEYENPAYGVAKVEMDKGALKFSYPRDGRAAESFSLRRVRSGGAAIGAVFEDEGRVPYEPARAISIRWRCRSRRPSKKSCSRAWATGA